MDEVKTRVPPQDIEAEKRILGCLMLNPKEIESVKRKLTPNDFYRDVHGKIYGVILGLVEKNDYVDVITVVSSARDQGVLFDVNVINEMVDRADMARLASDVSTVYGKAALRKIANIGCDLCELVFDIESGEKNITDLENEVCRVARLVREIKI